MAFLNLLRDKEKKNKMMKGLSPNTVRNFIFAFLCNHIDLSIATYHDNKLSDSFGEISSHLTCKDFNGDDKDDYWREVSNCDGCLAIDGCGYCLSTLTCSEGSIFGPSDGSPCPNWATSSERCPTIPSCDLHTSCSSCAKATECAWCPSIEQCLILSDIYARPDCKGAVFDPPCPSSLVKQTTVTGNLVIQGDEMLGGGELFLKGLCSASGCSESDLYSLTVDNGRKGFQVNSSSFIQLRAGDNAFMNDRGFSVDIKAGNGTNPVGGKGGHIKLQAGNGVGQVSKGGDVGDGGNVQIQAGDSIEGNPGNITLIAGSTVSGPQPGSIHLLSGPTTGKESQAASGSISLQTSHGSQQGSASGDIHIYSGDTFASSTTSGSIKLSTGATEHSDSGNIELQVGASGSQSGGNIVFESGEAKMNNGNVNLGTDDNKFKGGDVIIRSGGSAFSSTGSINIATTGSNSSHQAGSSGNLNLSSGDTKAGKSGSITINSGNSEQGQAGSIRIEIGNATGVPDLDAHGGDVYVRAGHTFGPSIRAGSIKIRAGSGLENSSGDSGHGGDVNLKGGSSNAMNENTGKGGHVSISSGDAISGTGGNLNLSSGISRFSSSGEVSIYSGLGGENGGSGNVFVKTGSSSSKSSGNLEISTGNSEKNSAGEIKIKPGVGTLGPGAPVIISGGETTDSESGGTVHISSGKSLSNIVEICIFSLQILLQVEALGMFL